MIAKLNADGSISIRSGDIAEAIVLRKLQHLSSFVSNTKDIADLRGA